jgi:GT2 family glycosyltransferase
MGTSSLRHRFCADFGESRTMAHNHGVSLSTGSLPGAAVACVLTYNRKTLLAECLEAIFAQTRPPEMVLILDNGSTDGTQQIVEGLPPERAVRIRYLRLEENIGAAAGFNRLFREAYMLRCEWAWVMDDDVLPEPTALAELGSAFAQHFGAPTDVGFLVSTAIDANGNPNNVPALDERRDANGCAIWAQMLGDGMVRVRNCGLTSILIPRWVLGTLGGPCPDFHIWGEDTDYTLRVTLHRPGFLVGKSRVLHVRGVPGFLEISTETDPYRISRFYYLYRNTVYLRRTYWPRHAFWLFIGRALLDIKRCLASRRDPLRRAWLVLSGTVAGLFFRPRYETFDEPLPEPVEAESPDVLRSTA